MSLICLIASTHFSLPSEQIHHWTLTRLGGGDNNDSRRDLSVLVCWDCWSSAEVSWELGARRGCCHGDRRVITLARPTDRPTNTYSVPASTRTSSNCVLIPITLQQAI